MHAWALFEEYRLSITIEQILILILCVTNIFAASVLQGVEEAFYSLVREIRRYKETNRSNKKSKKNTQRRCIIL